MRRFLLLVSLFTLQCVGVTASAEPADDTADEFNVTQYLRPHLRQMKETTGEDRVPAWKQKAMMALEAARKRSQEAAAIGALVPEAEEMLSEAQQAYQGADYVATTKLAGDAKRLTDTSIDTTYLKRAGEALAQARPLKSRMTPQMLTLLANTEATFSSRQGKKAYDMATTLSSQLVLIQPVARN